MRTIHLSLLLLTTALLGCPDERSPSAMPKPDDPSTNEPGHDTVPANPPPPRGPESKPPPLGQ
jgi:hypothetical protein